jgi:hypothetical protein
LAVTITGELRLITKILFSGAIVLGAALGLAAPAGADPSVFGVLSCGCREVAPADGPALTDKLSQGIQQGLFSLPSGTPVQ